MLSRVIAKNVGDVFFWDTLYVKKQAKAKDSYIAQLTGKPDQLHFTIIGSGSWSARANGAAALMWPSVAQLDPQQQLANAPSPQSTTPGLHPVSIHQMAPPKRTSDCSLLLIYRPQKDERLSWPSWLTCSGWFTQMQAEHRTGKVCQPKTDVLPLCHATINISVFQNPSFQSCMQITSMQLDNIA